MSIAAREALFFSDVHLGWALCATHHARWLRHLPDAVGDADLVVLNGDVIDTHRRVHRAFERDLVSGLGALVDRWRREGRTVVYVEGNHDSGPHPGFPLRPDQWMLDVALDDGRRARVLHGHRVAPDTVLWGRYDRAGRRLLALENRAYGRLRLLRSAYRWGPGWLVSLVGAIECTLARRAMPARIGPLLGEDVDVLVHGHIHYGRGDGWIGRARTWRSGAWVSPAHLGTADRMLRYRRGRFERITLERGRWRPCDDGR